MPTQCTLDEMVDLYVKHQDTTKEELKKRLDGLIAQYKPTHFVLFQCEVLDSSSLGNCFIMPVGPNNTYTLDTLPKMMSAKGLASDISCQRLVYEVDDNEVAG